MLQHISHFRELVTQYFFHHGIIPWKRWIAHGRIYYMPLYILMSLRRFSLKFFSLTSSFQYIINLNHYFLNVLYRSRMFNIIKIYSKYSRDLIYGYVREKMYRENLFNSIIPYTQQIFSYVQMNLYLVHIITYQHLIQINICVLIK